MSELQRNADTITRVLRRYSVDAQIVPGECFQSSGMNVLSVLPGPSTKVSAVTRLADELDDILTRSLGLPVAVRFETKPLRILVPRQQPRVGDALDVIARLQKRLRNERGLLALVGEAVGIRGAELRVADLTGSNTPHWLLAGTTGSGKTTALVGMVASLALLNKPQNVTIWVLDPKNELSFLRGLPSVARIISDANKCVKALSDAVAEMDKRSLHSIIDPSHRFVVVIDELADLLDVAGKDAEMMLKRILQKGRGLGIHVIAATQYPLADNIGATAKANFSVRLAFRTSSPEASKVATGMAGSGAERLPGRGAAVKVGASGAEFVQAFNVDKTRVAALGDESVSQYQFQPSHAFYTGRESILAQNTGSGTTQYQVPPVTDTMPDTSRRLAFDVYGQPTKDEARIIRAMLKGGMSKNKLIAEFLPNANRNKCFDFINAALGRQEVGV
jgi:DNA segregation ATPase FtsK/SpoIIIE-like protein